MQKIDRISLRVLVVIVAAGVLLGGALTTIGYNELSARSQADTQLIAAKTAEGYREQVKSLTEMAVSTIAVYQARAAAGELSLEDAQAQARAAMIDIVYGSDGYFWVHSYDPKDPGKVSMVSHPKTKLIGRDLAQLPYGAGAQKGQVIPGRQLADDGTAIDAPERPLFQQMNYLVQAQGGGFIAYDWPKKAEEAYQPKISYVKLVPGWNWVVGTGVYTDDVQAVVSSLQAEMDAGLASALRTMLLTFFVVLLAAAGFGVYLSRWLGRRIGLVTERLRDIAEGEADLTKRLDETEGDALGELAHWFNTFAGRMQGMLRGVADSSRPLGASVVSLDGISTNLAGTTDQIRSQSTLISDRTSSMSERLQPAADAATGAASRVAGFSSQAEQISSRVGSVSDSVQMLSSHMASVASAVTEMNASLGEVARNCAETADASRSSSTIADDARQQMQTLSEATARIAKVVELIEDIADQTNLLALNATIEAASAGEAGRGFAVVANEVKALAKQTSDATEEISRQMDGMVSDAQSAMDKITEVSDRSRQVMSLADMIAAAVEEQTATTNEISASVQESASRAEDISGHLVEVNSVVQGLDQDAAGVAQEVQRVATDVLDVAEASREVAGAATQFDGAVQQTADNATEVSSAATGMRSVSEQLSRMVAQFTV